MNVICFNGDFKKEDEPVLTVKNRAYKWGDAVFETIKVYNEKILLQELHFERLFVSLQLLKINLSENITQKQLTQKILELCSLNNCTKSARVRLQVFRNNDGLAEYSIEAFSLQKAVNNWNVEGLTLDYYPYGRKSCDAYSSLKTSNHLIYILAQLHAQENGLDDCIVLNSENKIADTSKANIFLVKNKIIYTPALSQGCVNGVMRRFLIDQLKVKGYVVHQKELTDKEIEEADEVFITNAIIGMQWVKKIKQKEFDNQLSALLYEDILKVLTS